MTETATFELPTDRNRYKKPSIGWGVRRGARRWACRARGAARGRHVRRGHRRVPSCPGLRRAHLMGASPRLSRL